MTLAAAATRSETTTRAGVLGWMFFDWAQQPFFTIVTTFIFAPWFADHVAANEAEGQAMWGFAMGTAGLVIALLSPILGSIADAGGRIKLWNGIFAAMLVVGSSALWATTPSTIPFALAAVALATVGAEFGIVFTNSLMPRLVPPEQIGRLSGGGWALGYAGGLIALALTLAFLIADRDTGLTLVGLPPLLSEGERWTGPLSALWFLVFSLPFFLFTPAGGSGLPFGPALRVGSQRLRKAANNLTGPLFRFLLARMLYQDGLNALFIFGGIYAAGVFGWGTTEIGVFGILLIVAGALGAWLGGVLDDRFGPKPIILAALGTLFVGALSILSIDYDRLFFVLPLASPPADGLFSTPAEQIYVLFGLLIGVASGPVQAASRSLLIRLARPEEITQAFGLFALSGRISAFAAPMMIGWLTLVSGSQRIGISALLIFLAAGFALLLLVNAGNDERP